MRDVSDLSTHNREPIMRRLAMPAMIIVFGCALAATSTAFADDPLQIIAAREAGYKKMAHAFYPIKKALAAGKPVTSFADDVQIVIDWGKRIPTMFPPGTEQGLKTRALPAVWSQREQLDRNAADLVTQAEKLKALAVAGDTDGFRKQYVVTGEVCNNCHKTYRAN
jgi:cytochrome c556